MEHKVLIADDSLTIQKVIKITLANEPFELHECEEATDLISKVNEIQPAMVLLDFNLSENKTGYDLCREIKEANPQVGVLMLFGTFDTIDEQLLHDCGCNYHIVKPFDGNKFINLCRSLATDFESGESSSTPAPSSDKTSEIKMPSKIDEESDEDNWVVNQPNVIDEEEEVSPEIESKQNELEKEVEAWGMEVPSVIDGEEEDVEMPDVIGDSTPSTQLTPADDLREESFELESNSGDTIDHEHEGTETEEEVKNLEEQIADEIEGGDLWAADDVVEEGETAEPAELEDEEDEEEDEGFKAFDVDEVESVNLEELDSSDDQFEEHAAAASSSPSDFPEDVTTQSASIDMSEIEDKIKDQIEKEIRDQIGPIVEKYVEQYCKEQVEKIAWEVIPDLAENLIKKEIQKISDSIMDS